MLWLSGVDNVFVNASSRQLSTTMYAKLFEINGSLSFLRGNLKLETETTYATVTSLVSAANTAQLTWISKGYESIQCELLRSGISPGIPLEKEAFKYFVRHTHQLLGDPCRLFLTSKRQGTLLVPIAHFCLKPTGPIALVVDCRFLGNLKNCTFILKIIFCSLFAGNSIVLFVTNIELLDDQNTFFNQIKLIQGRLSVTSLITIHKCTPSLSKDICRFLSNFRVPTTILILDTEDAFAKDPFDYVSNTLCLSRPVTLYWSTGCNTFS
ncbi:unnamed protein product [Heterobilharzia americana]|nr:unnamed protein product [Heterobilharzia americana]